MVVAATPKPPLSAKEKERRAAKRSRRRVEKAVLLNTSIDITEPAADDEVDRSETAACSSDPPVQVATDPSARSIGPAIAMAEPLTIRIGKLSRIVSTAAEGMLSQRLPVMASVVLPNIETLRATAIRCHRQSYDHIHHLQIQVGLKLASDGPVSSRISFPVSDDLKEEPLRQESNKRRRVYRSVARSPTPVLTAPQSEDDLRSLEDAAETAVQESSPFREGNPQVEAVEGLLVNAAISSMESEARRLARFSLVQRAST